MSEPSPAVAPSEPVPRRWLRGPILTAALVAAHLAASLIWPSLRDVSSFLFLAVVYATYRGGVLGGALSGIIAYAYFLYGFSHQGLFQYTRVDLDRLVCLGVVIPLAIVLIARQLRLEFELREARSELEAHARELEGRVRERTEELAASLESLQQVSSTIAHDLRNPVRYIAGFAELLADPSAGLTGENAGRVGRIRGNAARMDELIGDLLRYTRLHHAAPEVSLVELGPLVDRTLRRLADHIRDAQAVVTVVAPLPRVLANAELADEVLENLLTNALKFVPPGFAPVVTIAATAGPEGPRLHVRDQGIGVAPELRAKLFRPFERLHPYGNFPGTGIGLALVAKGMRQMGGRAGVEFPASGGSDFWLQFRRVPG